MRESHNLKPDVDRSWWHQEQFMSLFVQFVLICQRRHSNSTLVWDIYKNTASTVTCSCASSH